MPIPLVGNLSEYQKIVDRIAGSFHLSRCFPGMVFRKRQGTTVFCQYESVLGMQFWPAIRDLAALHGDTSVDFLVIRPSVKDYYLPEYGTFAAFTLSVDADSATYWKAISQPPQGGMTGAIVFSAEIIAISGPSSDWGCWGERDYGIAAFHSEGSDLCSWAEKHGPFLDATDALRDFVAPNFASGRIPESFSSVFLDNYSEW